MPAIDITTPLAARMRPTSLDEYVGHADVIGPNTPLRNSIERDCLQSTIIWGPASSGKTSLATVIAHETKAAFEPLSATSAKVSDVRKAIADAQDRRPQKTILFIDEIHRFSKAQQDALLPAVEAGIVTLIGATTENPSFSVTSALLSRCRVVRLEPLEPDDIKTLISRALTDPSGIPALNISATIDDDAQDQIAKSAAGDARRALTTLETCVISAPAGQTTINISKQDVLVAAPDAAMSHDRTGDDRYDLISALHKSVRNSDADAAVYWCCRMLEGGEDPLYVARRLVRMASEDIGLADPNALVVATAAWQATQYIGFPECSCALTECAVYLALAPKSNACEVAYNAARDVVHKDPVAPVPYQVRNAPTKLMADMGMHAGYRYAHDYPDHIATQQALPDGISGPFYTPQGFGEESAGGRISGYWQWVRQWHATHDGPDDVKPVRNSSCC